MELLFEIGVKQLVSFLKSHASEVASDFHGGQQAS